MVLTNVIKLFGKLLSVDTPADTEVIKFDSATDSWIASATSVNAALTDLTDVTLSSASSGDYLRKGAGD